MGILVVDSEAMGKTVPVVVPLGDLVGSKVPVVVPLGDPVDTKVPVLVALEDPVDTKVHAGSKVLAGMAIPVLPGVVLEHLGRAGFVGLSDLVPLPELVWGNKEMRMGVVLENMEVKIEKLGYIRMQTQMLEIRGDLKNDPWEREGKRGADVGIDVDAEEDMDMEVEVEVENDLAVKIVADSEVGTDIAG